MSVEFSKSSGGTWVESKRCLWSKTTRLIKLNTVVPTYQASPKWKAKAEQEPRVLRTIAQRARPLLLPVEPSQTCPDTRNRQAPVPGQLSNHDSGSSKAPERPPRLPGSAVSRVIIVCTWERGGVMCHAWQRSAIRRSLAENENYFLFYP